MCQCWYDEVAALAVFLTSRVLPITIGVSEKKLENGISTLTVFLRKRGLITTAVWVAYELRPIKNIRIIF
jgi:hypothetical protein